MTFDGLKNSTMLKLFITGFITLVLLIPLGMVKSIVHERKSRRDSAVYEVSSKWGHVQKISGPVLVVPYRNYYRDEKNILRMKIENAYFLPESLRINGKIIPEKRARGLYEVMLYKLEDLRFSGYFKSPDFKVLRIKEYNMIWEDAYITVGIPDTRGVKKDIVMNWNNRVVKFSPGVKGVKIYSSGIHAEIKNLAPSPNKKYNFNFTIDLQGSSSLSFAPMGKETIVDLDSTWEHPSFFGAYLPSSRNLSEKGFSANWKISYFGRNFPQEWIEADSPRPGDISRVSFGVEMYLPVDFYQKSMRAVKYGFLFVSLTFITFFLFEIMNGFKIHPIQYLMIGFAMCLFYLLFLSLSEHINFILSYLISSFGVIGLITGYSVKVLKKRGRAVYMSGLLATLYGYLFILLQNQDYALLLGALGFFVILGIVMYLTRNIDWYNVKLNREITTE